VNISKTMPRTQDFRGENGNTEVLQWTTLANQHHLGCLSMKLFKNIYTKSFSTTMA